jgi:hypothetical protein
MAQQGRRTRLRGRRQAEQVRQRMHGDQHRRARCKTKQSGRRNEIGQRAQAQRAYQPLHDAHHDSDHQRHLDIGRTKSQRHR